MSWAALVGGRNLAGLAAAEATIAFKDGMSSRGSAGYMDCRLLLGDAGHMGCRFPVGPGLMMRSNEGCIGCNFGGDIMLLESKGEVIRRIVVVSPSPVLSLAFEGAGAPGREGLPGIGSFKESSGPPMVTSGVDSLKWSVEGREVGGGREE